MNNVWTIIPAPRASSRTKQHKILLSCNGAIIPVAGNKTEIKCIDPEKVLSGLYQMFTTDILDVKYRFPEILSDTDTPEYYEMEMNLNQKR